MRQRKTRKPVSDDIRELRFLAASLVTLTNLFRRESALAFQRLFGLSLVESHIVARLGLEAPVSLDSLSHRIGLAKSQMSRSVSNLVAQKIVRRERPADNNREVRLSLTARGREIHAALMRGAEQKNKLFTAGINRRDLEHLKRLVDHLIANSREILRREQELSGEDPDANGLGSGATPDR